jgi:hypothetical protein
MINFNKLTFLFLLMSIQVYGQSTKIKVLYLGNSFTYVNNLPQIISDVAASMNDTILFESNALPSYSLEGHSTNTTSIGKIMQGYWNYVVLQEGLGVFLNNYYSNITYNLTYAVTLNNLIHQYNSDCKTVIYMVWGRKYGCCTALPCNNTVNCTYSFQDSIAQTYSINIAQTINAPISPVAAVWNYLINHYPSLELYNSDFAHPSKAGSYAAACCFYTVFFKKDPTLIPYNYSIAESDANIIKNAVKVVVFDSLAKWQITQNVLNVSSTWISDNFNVYPNPAHDWFKVKSYNSQNSTLDILDFQGKLIIKTSLVSDIINISNLPAGIYILRFKDAEKLVIKKLIKN